MCTDPGGDGLLVLEMIFLLSMLPVPKPCTQSSLTIHVGHWGWILERMALGLASTQKFTMYLIIEDSCLLGMLYTSSFHVKLIVGMHNQATSYDAVGLIAFAMLHCLAVLSRHHYYSTTAHADTCFACECILQVWSAHLVTGT